MTINGVVSAQKTSKKSLHEEMRIEPIHCKICLGKYNQKNLVKFIWLLPQMCLV